MSKSSGSGFASFKRAVSGGNKVGNDEKSSGEFQTIFFSSFPSYSNYNFHLDLI